MPHLRKSAVSRKLAVMSSKVKVSGFVSHAEHVQLATLAAQNGTTIGAIVGYALRETVKRLKHDPALGRRLQPDQRRAVANAS